MFCQPGAPSYSAFTVDSNTITVNSYKVLRGQEPILFNTFYIKRTKEHGTSQSIKQTIKNGGVAKVFYAGNMYLLRENIAYNALGQIVLEEDILSKL